MNVGPEKEHNAFRLLKNMARIISDLGCFSNVDDLLVNNLGSEEFRKNNCYLVAIAARLKMTVENIASIVKVRQDTGGGTNSEMLKILRTVTKAKGINNTWDIQYCGNKDGLKAKLCEQYFQAERKGKDNPKLKKRDYIPCKGKIAIRRIVTYSYKDNNDETFGHASIVKVWRDHGNKDCSYKVVEYQIPESERKDECYSRIPDNALNTAVFNDTNFYRRHTCTCEQKLGEITPQTPAELQSF